MLKYFSDGAFVFWLNHFSHAPLPPHILNLNTFWSGRNGW